MTGHVDERHRVLPASAAGLPWPPGPGRAGRRLVRRTVASHGAVTDAALLTSELATNAVQHTASGQGGTFEVIICQLPATVRIAVLDAGSLAIPAPPPPPG